jgi:hypothetical protein
MFASPIISSTGQLSVKNGKKLDYDYGRRSYTIGVDVKTSDGQTGRFYFIPLYPEKTTDLPQVTDKL